MKDFYITKKDINGNVCRLIINHETKKIMYDYACNLFLRKEATTTTKKNLQRIRAEYKKAGYMEV